ncbi:tyrosine-type recombinase/integrase [Paracraurococcus lichenis]|uniref:Site-specific integrase n=1 Tax=Paracraurococcus lichenis TaxID=3064888 RepID=A0ABT9EE83_9PROT|nr:site-specific integrase [Paracraurococcus sp. LOR1-02]MDO9714293.1 site-specific integrase [Paracraurococcus sp. LOR1-02]
MDGVVVQNRRRRIGLREVRALRSGEMIWDAAVIGFGARRQKSETVSYILFYRTAEGRQRWYTIGRHGSPWMPETARAEALRLLGEVARGGDPSVERQARRHGATLTVTDLCDRYLDDAEAGRLLTRRRVAKRPSTLTTDRSRITAHIKPVLGPIPVGAVTCDDVERLMHRIAEGGTSKRTKLDKRHALSNVRGGKGAASRTIGLLGAIMSYAVKLGLRSDNPVQGVVRPADGRRDRRLQPDEYRRLGEALIAGEDDEVWGPGLAALRFMLLTGWRSGEVLGLRWSEVDLVRRTARLTDTKTGASMRPLAEAACSILREMFPGEVVFRAPGGDVEMKGFRRVWSRTVHRIAGLTEDVTPHVLRHSYASLAADLGLADATIAALLGHRGHSVTRRYIHSADTALLAAADKVAAETIRLMGEV